MPEKSCLPQLFIDISVFPSFCRVHFSVDNKYTMYVSNSFGFKQRLLTSAFSPSCSVIRFLPLFTRAILFIWMQPDCRTIFCRIDIWVNNYLKLACKQNMHHCMMNEQNIFCSFIKSNFVLKKIFNCRLPRKWQSANSYMLLRSLASGWLSDVA